MREAARLDDPALGEPSGEDLDDPFDDELGDDPRSTSASESGGTALAGTLALDPLIVDLAGDGWRLDRYLAQRLPEVSRSRIQRWIADAAVLRNGQPARPRSQVRIGDRIEVKVPAEAPVAGFAAEPVPVPVVWEDETLIVIDKPAGLVVHPGAGNWSGTLLNGLLAHDPRLALLPRAGIVHRLDAGTSGLMVVARTGPAQLDLVRQLQARTVAREYWALAAGAVAPALTIDAPLARDPRNRLRFCVSRSATARPARTFVRRLAHWGIGDPPTTISWIACRLDTGRTHQIRVHLESILHPLVGDPIYRRHLPAPLAARPLLSRQALHACRLELIHPLRRETMAWSSAPPADMRDLMRSLGATDAQLRAPRRMSIARAAAADEAPAQAAPR
jgi:23S rRNA pseudouridine1911/1915/1917 synthase